jgi:3D (Asp-Asp-Asp) domain-containing protein
MRCNALLCLVFAASVLADGQVATKKAPVRTTTPTEAPVRGGPLPFIATAYSTKGNTVKGVETQPGIVAADKRVLPLGSTIRVTEAGEYSGLYVVTDLGTAIVGNRIDIYIAELEDAKAFVRKDVMVELLAPGDNVKFQPETTNTIPKNALAPAQKEDAVAIPGKTVPADKPAVQQGRAVKAQEKGQEKKAAKKTVPVK